MKAMAKIKVDFTTRLSKWNLIAFLIRKILGTKFSHVIVTIQIPRSETSLAYEAGAFGVSALSETEISKRDKILHRKEFEVTEEEAAKMHEFCVSNLHKKYGFLTIIGLYLALCFGILNRIGKDGNKTFICSEFVAKVLKIVKSIAKVLKIQNVNVDKMTPLELYILMRSI